ncbi:RRS1-domain-containing protein [Athelia psychrophila]|uniref:Ribosome biogenesis regulatory protein n=1 Tax=Athelia psychrophila TaxID=1759441 RepID=A0A166ISF8_9AGAM|nr:RRS1-domain-containing protein [Fibularhizoctonia sp. CBS 109695]
MDVSNILASHAAKFQSVTVEKDTPLDVDTGFLTVTDSNPIDEDSYNDNLEEYLQSTARDGVQSLFTSLFSLPTVASADGPLAKLPPPTTQLPRCKPLPKPKPQTKWERFASAKGIQHKVRDKRVWDEEKQDWVNRWGKDGKNKEKEEQWISEVPHNADLNFDPVKKARDERKGRVAKNEKQRLGNVARAAPRERDVRKKEIDTTLATTRISTASMGKFDKKLEGEKKLRGIKRKFEPAESNETQASLAILSGLDGETRRTRKESGKEGDDVLNVRKAIHKASGGRGGIALGRAASGGRGGGGKRGGRGGKR